MVAEMQGRFDDPWEQINRVFCADCGWVCSGGGGGGTAGTPGGGGGAAAAQQQPLVTVAEHRGVKVSPG